MLTAEGLENLREEYFYLLYCGKGAFSHEEVDNMPVYWRKWYFKRLAKQVEADNKL